MKKTNKNKGYTLMELIISLAMVAIITGAVLQVARFSDTHKNLTLSTDELRAVLRTAQSSSLSIPIIDSADDTKHHICGYGVYINNATDYELFYTYVRKNDFRSDPNSCFNDSDYRVYNAPGYDYDTIQSFQLTEGLQFNSKIAESIFFLAPYGEACDDNGNIMDSSSADEIFTVQKTSDGASRTINVNAFGKMD